MIPEYVIHAKLKNNLLLSRILQQSDSVGAFCAEHGLSAGVIGELINLKSTAAIGKKGWRKPVLQLAEIFSCEPGDLFTEEQATVALKTNEAYVEMTRQQALCAFAGGTDPVALLEDQDAVKTIHAALLKLTERQQQVLEARMNGDTFEQIAQAYGVTKERIRQIEAKALRRLRHPLFAGELIELIPDRERYAPPADEKEWTIAGGQKKPAHGEAG